MYQIRSARHQRSLEYALKKIKESVLQPYVKSVVLYGSCARQQEKYSSDVDLLVELSPEVKYIPDYKKEILLMRSNVTTDNIDDPETDLKVCIGNNWKTDRHLFYMNVRKDGEDIWS